MKTSSQNAIVNVGLGASFPAFITIFSLLNLMLIIDVKCMKKQGEENSSTASNIDFKSQNPRQNIRFGSIDFSSYNAKGNEQSEKRTNLQQPSFSQGSLPLIRNEDTKKQTGIQKEKIASSSSHTTECYDLPLTMPQARKDLANKKKESILVCKKCGNLMHVIQSFDGEGNMVLEKIEHKAKPNFVRETEFDYGTQTRGHKLRFFDENGNELPTKTKNNTFLTEKAKLKHLPKLKEIDEKFAKILPIQAENPNQLVTNLVDLDENSNLIHKMTHRLNYSVDGKFKPEWEIYEDGKIIKFNNIDDLHEHLGGKGEAGEELKRLSIDMKGNLRKRGEKIFGTGKGETGQQNSTKDDQIEIGDEILVKSGEINSLGKSKKARKRKAKKSKKLNELAGQPIGEEESSSSSTKNEVMGNNLLAENGKKAENVGEKKIENIGIVEKIHRMKNLSMDSLDIDEKKNP